MTRRLPSLVATVAVVGAGLVAAVVPVAPAAAFMQDPLVIRDGPATTRTYPGIKGNYAGTQAVTFTPSGCGNEDDTAPAQASCDRVPLDIVPPDIGPADDWYLELAVTWRPTESARNGVQDAQLCDLDIALYDDTQIEGRSSDEPGYTKLAESATSSQPESVRTFAPELGRYNLVINNFAGANVDYTITARLVIGRFEAPFEALAPTARNADDGADDTRDDGVALAPVDRSGDDRPSSTSGTTSGAGTFSASAPLAPPLLGEVAVLPESDFASFGEADGFDRRLRAPTTASDLPFPELLRPPAEVPAVLVMFWLVLVPLVLAGAGAVLVLRRRSAVLL